MKATEHNREREASMVKRFCRQKGTRMNAVMTAIENGATNDELKRRFGMGAKTSNVYRKALAGMLTGGARTLVQTPPKKEE